MVVHLHRDCFFLDGTAASIKIDDVREIRSQLGEPPREARMRMVVFREAQALGVEAANALLKSFEEPLPATSFVLLAPQRERLLPTLVSRSLVLTLPWPVASAQEDRLASWEAALCAFLATGQGLFERTGTRGAVDASLVHALIGFCRRALAGRILAVHSPAGGLEDLLAPLAPRRLRFLDEALAEAQDSLVFGVNPVLILEWLATRMYFLVSR
jgi:DNA polymerase-3 subunit delta'